MMYQCGRCGLTRASSQEPMGLVTPQCKCPFEFIPPVAPQRKPWVGLTLNEMDDLAAPFHSLTYKEIRAIEAKLKEKNT